MSIEIGWFSFDGPFPDESELKAKAGVFTILSLEEGERYSMLDVDEGENVAETVKMHPRRSCWAEHTGKSLHYAVFYFPEEDIEARQTIVKEIRMQYVMVCSPSETPTKGWWRPEEQ
ncbi:MAG: hypothetical protein V2A56_13245 [bacterium]